MLPSPLPFSIYEQIVFSGNIFSIHFAFQMLLVHADPYHIQSLERYFSNEITCCVYPPMLPVKQQILLRSAKTCCPYFSRSAVSMISNTKGTRTTVMNVCRLAPCSLQPLELQWLLAFLEHKWARGLAFHFHTLLQFGSHSDNSQISERILFLLCSPQQARTKMNCVCLWTLSLFLPTRKSCKWPANMAVMSSTEHNMCNRYW